MRAVRKFDTKQEQLSFAENFRYIFINNNNNKTSIINRKDYTGNYLSLVAIEEGTFTFTMESALTTTIFSSVSYSIDNGNTWVETANVDNEEVIVTTPIIGVGEKVLWKGNGRALSVNIEEYNGSRFSSTCNFNAEGNVASILFGDDFNEHYDLSDNYLIYYKMFYNSKIVNAKNLILEGKKLTYHSYESMFENCIYLKTAPTLQATELGAECYAKLFKGCTSLNDNITICATALNGSSCYSMFEGCVSLSAAPQMDSVESISSNSCEAMFSGCTSLVSAPKLDFLELSSDCYANMFSDCTSLKEAPTLPATELVYNCYKEMFSNCSQLNYVKALFLTEPSDETTNNWLSNVAENGTFVKNSEATWDVIGSNGIPENWTIEQV